MAVVGEDNDPMRAIIAGVADQLNTDDGGDTDAGADAGDTDAVDAGADTGAVDSEADAGAAADAGADAAADGAADATGAVATEAGADKAVVADTAAAPAEKAAADAGAKGKAKTPTKKDQELEAFAKEHGLKAKDAMGRENRIPHSVVAGRIVPNAIKKERVKWDAEVLAPERAKNRVYEERLGSIKQTEEIMFGNPRQYLSMLATGVPGYSQLFEELRGGKPVVEGKEEAKPGVGTNLADDPEPQPDAKDDKGNAIGYTTEGFRKLREWDRRQASAEAEKKLEARFKPLMSREERSQESERLNQTVDAVITHAAEWPGFTENHAAILEELAKGKDALDSGPKMHKALQQAYNAVMFGAVTKKVETEQEMRDRHFAEFQTGLRRAPRSTSTIAAARRNEPAAEDENVSPDDRMRNIIASVASKLK